MSNQQVGKVYDQLIKSIIEASRVDFEESGVDASTLQALQKGWQDRLTESGVASFPWAEEVKPPPGPIANPPTLLSNAGHPNPRPSVPQSASTKSFDEPAIKSENIKPENIKTEPQIKTEASSGSPLFATNSNGHNMNPALSNPHSASNRASKLVMEKFGSQAGQSGLMMPGQQRPGLQLPGQPQPPANPITAQYQAQSQARAGAGAGSAQTDGPADDAVARWQTIMSSQRGDAGEGSSSKSELDVQLAQYIRERGKALDDGGISITLDEYKANRRSRKRKLAPLVASNPDAGVLSAEAALTGLSVAPSSRPGLPTIDGTNDDEDSKEADEDAINSDLDDPEEELADDNDEDDSSMDMMLCMYEKVQRVKNKWKCTLKDGVLTVNRKEYVFHKSTGEYEW